MVVLMMTIIYNYFALTVIKIRQLKIEVINLILHLMNMDFL